jgi:hypothetical protein
VVIRSFVQIRLSALLAPGIDIRTPLTEFPIGAVTPEGWLREQLVIQADGLTGHLDELWQDVGPTSAWLGGNGEDWENGPYYLDGLVPLAYTLGDERLIGKARLWIEAILDGQKEDGSFGPASNPDWWSRMIAIKALAQYFDATADNRILDFMERYFDHQRRELPNRPLTDWGRARGHENALAVFWLDDRRASARYGDVAEQLLRQSIDWGQYLTEELIQRPATEFDHRTHVVNVAMGFRYMVAQAQMGQWNESAERFRRALENLDRYHGMITGMFSGDEWLAGTAPEHGVELCAVVEFLYSLEQGFRWFEDPALLDRAERVAYNMLAAHVSADGRSHQYHQQINQIACSIARRNWTYSSDDANTFALEPHFGCCTANLHQGWPKLVRALWYRRGTRLMTGLHAPNRLRTEIDNVPVQIVVETDYPFGEKLVYRVEVGAAVRFELWLRIPGWCNRPKIESSFGIPPTMMSGFACFEREWSSGEQIRMELPQRVRLINRPSGGVGFELGPWIMALSPGEIWERIPGSTGFGDYEVRARYSWNYGLLAFDPEKTPRLVGPRSSPPFQIGWISRLPVAPVMIEVTGRLLKDWSVAEGSAASVPVAPHSYAPEQKLILVPYGCTRIRIAEFPVLSG